MATEAGAGDRRARRVQGLVRRLSFHLSGAQLGITATSLVLGFVSAPVVARVLSPAIDPLLGERAAQGVAVTFALVLATTSQMVLGELVPKSLAIARPERSAKRLAGAIAVYGVVFGPLIRFLNGAANRTVRLLGIEPREELATVRTLPEFELIFRSSADGGALARSAATLLHRSLRLARKTAADTLVPRTQVQALSVEATVDDLVELSRRTGHSRFPVHGGDLDDVRGVVHVQSVHEVPRSERSGTRVDTLASEALAVPESRDLDDLLSDMRATRHHLAVVVDEHGGTAGIVTLEDVIEQIVGDIADEHDARAPRLTRSVRPGEWLLAGSLHPDEVAEETGLSIPEGDYETLAGFVLARLGRIPEPGESFEEEGWRFEVDAMDRRRVDRVRVVAPPVDGTAVGPDEGLAR